MASEIVQVWASVSVNNTGVVAGLNDMLVSADLDNQTGTIYNSMKATINYDNINPAPGIGSWALSTIVEAKDTSGKYHPILHQFNDFRGKDRGEERVLILQPDLDTFSLGIDDIVFIGEKTVSQISRSQGHLPQGEYRLRCVLNESDPGGANAFVSVSISAEVELYNV